MEVNLSSLIAVPPCDVSSKTRVELCVSFSTQGQETTRPCRLVVETPQGAMVVHEAREEPITRGLRCLRHFFQPQDAGEHRAVFTMGEEERTHTFTVYEASFPSLRHLSGSFLTFVHGSDLEAPWNARTRNFTAADWAAVARSMNGLGMRIVVMQHLVLADEAYYPSEIFPVRDRLACHDPVEAFLAEADRLGMFVFLGLWQDVRGDVPMGNEVRSRIPRDQAELTHQRVASELFARYGHHPSFYGWYCPNEGMFSGSLPAYCHSLTPHRPVLLAPYVKPEKPDFCYPTATTGPMILAIQDGVGCWHRYKRDTLNDYYRKWSQSTGDRVHLWADLELFDLSPNLLPASISRLRWQIGNARAFCETLLGYQFVGMMDDPGSPARVYGEGALEFFRRYGAYREQAAPFVTIIAPMAGDRMPKGCEIDVWLDACGPEPFQVLLRVEDGPLRPAARRSPCTFQLDEPLRGLPRGTHALEAVLIDGAGQAQAFDSILVRVV